MDRFLPQTHILTNVDETRPTCHRCRKRGVDCDGPRAPTWIDQSGSFRTKLAPKISVLRSDRITELPFIAFREDICLAYSRRRLLRGGPFGLACDKICFQENAPIFFRDPALGLLRKAIVSLAKIHFGFQHSDHHTTVKGYVQYGEVLRQLKSALAFSYYQTTNEILLTALICMLLETLFPTSASSFLQHQRGIENIMRLRGPPVETTGETATIFRGLRIVSIASALLESRPSIYANEEWKNAPVADTSEIGALQHKFFSILAMCSQLTSECGVLMTSGVGAEGHGPLLSQVDAAMVNLTALYPLWERINESCLDNNEHQSRLTRELGIADHLTATAYMLYHTVRICILQMRELLNPSPIHSVLRNDAAMKIVRCLELKEIEKQEGSRESNTISLVATKIVWQALGGFNTLEGQTLAHVVTLSVDGGHHSPRNNLSA
jgi:hypothetical protein